jgi:hypothetical protein
MSNVRYLSLAHVPEKMLYDILYEALSRTIGKMTYAERLEFISADRKAIKEEMLAKQWAAQMKPRIHVVHDEEANVLIATSPDVPGLVVESATYAELVQDVSDCLEMLAQEQSHQREN